jgi:hypothetical protein
MGNRYAIHKFDGGVSSALWTAYDSAKQILGTLIKQLTGANPEDKWAGPLPTLIGRPMEQSTTISSAYPVIIEWSSTKWWVFMADIATAAATRRISLWELDWTAWTLAWKGFVTLTYPSATAHTIRGFRVSYEKYTTGTASVNGTAVTGTGTAWSTSRIPVGCRIGFGSSNPASISTWYEISAIGSDTGITLTASAGVIADGTYVIEDLRVITANTNATTTNGGLFMAKGLRYELFIQAGTTIAAAVATDGVRAVYWLADAATVTNTTTGGCGLKARDSWTQQYIYCSQGGGGTSVAWFKYNICKDLTLASGKDTTAFVYATGNQALTGNLSQVNNGRLDTLNHGAGSGVLSMYFVTASRVYRAAESNLTSGNTTWMSDVMTEVPPGTVNTYAATGTLASLEVSSTLDKLIVVTTTTYGYITQYRTDNGQMDARIFMTDSQLDQGSMSSDAVPHPNAGAAQFNIWVQGGLAVLIRGSTSATTNIVYVMPLGAHWGWQATSKQRLATPSMATTNCRKYDRVSVAEAIYLGSGEIGQEPDGYKLYYRTAGISDDSGSWTLVGQAGDMSAVGYADAIQFMFEFRTLSPRLIPARVFAVQVGYESNDETDSHYEGAVNKSDTANRRFAYRQKAAFGTNIPRMRIRLYNAGTGVSVLDDDTTTAAYGTWEYSTNGTSWNAWDASKDTVGYYIRYTATSLPDGIDVRALLTLY